MQRPRVPNRCATNRNRDAPTSADISKAPPSELTPSLEEIPTGRLDTATLWIARAHASSRSNVPNRDKDTLEAINARAADFSVT